MRFLHLLLTTTALASLPAGACTVLLTDTMTLPLNSADIGNGDRLSITRHYMAAREWTSEGAMAAIDAAAFEWERFPAALARQRGERLKSFLILLGMKADDIAVSERVISGAKDKLDQDEQRQLGVQFVPKCPDKGCQSLCNAADMPGVATHAETEDMRAQSSPADGFGCANIGDSTRARVLLREQWTPQTIEAPMVLRNDDHTPLAGVCYRITTSARQYIGITDAQGQTEKIQVLGPEYTRIEVTIAS